ncbi:AI-2E family transporter [Mesorhizobium sp. YM1C-6-2]|uniref:AI-2E family transporter n=1 Tax=Mesorhizobium sp. YM1C-6-2 TaxID=1827501 RepID=UPI0026807550
MFALKPTTLGIAPGGRSAPDPVMGNHPSHPPAYPKAIAVIATVAALYFGRDIFIPLAMAILLTFALSPLVAALRKVRVPRPAAVIAVVIGAFAAIFMFGAVVASQLGTLAQNIPLYQYNLVAKVEVIKDAKVGGGVFERLSKLLERLGRESQVDEEPNTVGGPGSDDPSPPPIPVEVITPPPGPLQVLRSVVGPLIQPLATGGIIIVVVIFMLLRREDLRDRFIRLVGAGDLHRTTAALQDAGDRVARYLLSQLAVNAAYALPIGIGLWVIGVPNAPLWGFMALILRFIPYIGPIIASIFPLALALAVDPGWTMVLWTAALFVVLELVSNNVVEPWVYGSRTGLSPLAIIVAAIFWTWLWGPMGLLLSTPLTVCLVVLGRHVPQFEFLDVLLGNEPVLDLHQQLYQRLLAGDPTEATERAEAYLEENTILSFYETVAVPALALAEEDRSRGVLTDERRSRVAESAQTLVNNLDDFAFESDEESEPKQDLAIEPTTKLELPLPNGEGRVIACAGGRGEFDDAAAAMLVQVLKAQGATTNYIEHTSLAPGRIRQLSIDGLETIVIVFLNPSSVQHARYMTRRLKRLRPSLRVGILLCNTDTIEPVKLIADVGTGFVASTLAEAAAQSLEEPRPWPPMPLTKTTSRRKASSPKAKQTA